jgi:nitrogen regulatory protein PII
MYGLFLILNDIYKLDTIHEIFYEEELGATTIDSQGMGKVLLDHQVNIPMLASMRKLIDGRKPYNKMIVSVIQEKDKLDRVVKKINQELECFSEPGVGFMFVVPVLEIHGSKHECVLEKLENGEEKVEEKPFI